MAVSLEAFKDELVRRITEAVQTTGAHATYLAKENAPVRKIFKGGRRRVRHLSGAELMAERDIRKRLGLATKGPIDIEIDRRQRRPRQPTNPLLKAFGRRSPSNAFNPILSSGQVSQLNTALAGRARTTPSITLSSTGKIKVGALPENLEELQSRIGSLRTVNPRRATELAGGPALEEQLTGRGRYEVRSGRAVSGTTVGGALRNSVRLGEIEVNGSEIKISVIAGDKQAYYAKYVEFGTRHAAGQPFLRPALAKVREEFRQRIARAVTQPTRKVEHPEDLPTPARVAAAKE